MQKSIRVMGTPSNQPGVGSFMFVGDEKVFWTGECWVTEAALWVVMSPPSEREGYDRHNRRREAIKASR